MLSSFALISEIKAASFNFSPSSKTFKRQCESSLDLLIDATGQSSNSAEVIINFDPALITILDQDGGQAGIQIEEGNAYTSYFYNDVNNSTGTIRLAAMSIGSPLNTNRLFGRIHFNSTAAAATANFTIQFTPGSTTDSNIAEDGTANDILSSVTNGSYSFTSTTSCEDDFGAPSVVFLNPTSNQTNVAVDTNLTFRIVDKISGVNLSSLSFVLNGVTYNTSSPYVSYTGTGTDYTFTINPPSNLPANQSNSLNVSGSDLAGNNFSSQIVFYTAPNPTSPPPTNPPPTPTPTPDTTPPTVVFVNPINQDTNVGSSEDIVVEVLDSDSGVNLDEVVIFFNGEEYTVNSPEVTYTQIEGGYRFVIKPIGGIPTNQVNYLRIIGEDNAGNNFEDQILFNVPISEQLTCPNPFEDDESLPETGGTVYIPQDGEIIIDSQGRRVLIQNCYGENLDSGEFSNILDKLLQSGNSLFEGTPFEGTILDTVTKEAGIAGLGAFLTSLLIIFNLLPLLSIISIPGAAFQFIGILLGKVNKNPWGTITDAFTGKPVPFAVCQLFVSGAQFKMNQTVSDLEGRYGFVINPGDYRLEVKQSGYKPYVEEISIREGDVAYLNDIKLKKEIFEESSEVEGPKVFSNIRRRIWNTYRKVSNVLFVVGFASAIIAVLFNPVLFNIILFLIYLLIAFSLAAPKFLMKGKYSSVVDSATGLRIPYAQVKIFDLQTWKLIDSQVTSYNGQFDYYGEPGQYAVLVAARGYKFPSNKNTYDTTDSKYSSMLKLPLKKGRNKVKLYVDPGSPNTEINTGTMNSPFSA